MNLLLILRIAWRKKVASYFNLSTLYTSQIILLLNLTVIVLQSGSNPLDKNQNKQVPNGNE